MRHYLDEHPGLPFKAKRMVRRIVSLLEAGEAIDVVGVAPRVDCMDEMFIGMERKGRRMGAPFPQLERGDKDSSG